MKKCEEVITIDSLKNDSIKITLTATADKPFEIIQTPFVTPAAQYTEDYMRNNIFVFSLYVFFFSLVFKNLFLSYLYNPL